VFQSLTDCQETWEGGEVINLLHNQINQYILFIGIRTLNQ